MLPATSPAPVIWFFGLRATGKSTLANALADRLRASGTHAVVLDVDTPFRGASDADANGFTADETVRRTADLAKHLSQQGSIVLVAFNTLKESQRDVVRYVIPHVELVFLRCTIAVRMERYGLNPEAGAGESDGGAEPPVRPVHILLTHDVTIENCVTELAKMMELNIAQASQAPPERARAAQLPSAQAPAFVPEVPLPVVPLNFVPETDVPQKRRSSRPKDKALTQLRARSKQKRYILMVAGIVPLLLTAAFVYWTIQAKRTSEADSKAKSDLHDMMASSAPHFKASDLDVKTKADPLSVVSRDINPDVDSKPVMPTPSRSVPKGPDTPAKSAAEAMAESIQKRAQPMARIESFKDTLGSEAGDTGITETSGFAPMPDPKNGNRLLINAQEAMDKLVKATTWDARLPLVFRPDMAGPRMKVFYEDRKQKDPAMDKFTGYRFASLDGKPLLQFVYKQPDGTTPTYATFYCDGDMVKLDWESLVGWCDLEWKELQEKRPVAPVVMRVLIAPTDYYNYEYTDSRRWMAMKLCNQDGNQSIYGYVDRKSDLGVSFGLQGGASTIRRATVLVSYPPAAQSGNCAQLIRILADRWLAAE